MLLVAAAVSSKGGFSVTFSALVLFCFGTVSLAQTSQEVVVEVPDLVVVGRPAPREVVVDVPDLVVIGRPAPQEVIINVPDLVIVGRPAPQEVIVDVPDLVVVGEPDPREVVIDVPDLIVVGEPEERDTEPNADDVGSSKTAGSGPPLQGQKNVSSNGVPSDAPLSSDPGVKIGANRICVGEYTLHSAGAVGSGYGNPEMPVGTPVIAKATLTTDSCGAFLTMTSQGQSILLARQQDGDNVYVGELKMPDGVARTLRLTCGRGLDMHGVLYARDDNVSLRRSMWLRPVNATTTTLAACAK
jgi:hypothetical protein